MHQVSPKRVLSRAATPHHHASSPQSDLVPLIAPVHRCMSADEKAYEVAASEPAPRQIVVQLVEQADGLHRDGCLILQALGPIAKKKLE